MEKKSASQKSGRSGIIREITGNDSHKIFVYREYLDILNRGTEPIS